MPTLHVELFEGRCDEQKRDLVLALTEATCSVLDCTPEAVDVVLVEISRVNWATAGILWSDRDL